MANSSSQSNPMGVHGIEFVEYVTTQPLALGALLARAGFAAVARHRSREVMLYRQGRMNVIVNAAPDAPFNASAAAASTHIGAVALRVKNAAQAYKHAVSLGAWEVATHAREMELNIPAIRGPGDSAIYFVDRPGDFSIYDIDFVPLPNVDQFPHAKNGEHFFGVVQLVQPGRLAAWEDFYQTIFGFTTIPSGRFFGVVNKGELLESPCNLFFWQLIEPPTDAMDVQWDEALVRLGIGTPNVEKTQALWESQGINFLPLGKPHADEPRRGAVTEVSSGGACFELVLSAGLNAHPDAKKAS